MKQEIFQQLEQLKGQTREYKGKNIEIKSFKEVNGSIVIYTEKRTYAFLPGEIETFFNDLGEKKQGSDLPQIVKNKLSGYEPSTENIQVKNALLETLKKVQADPDQKNLDQAKSICDIANTFVNIQKVEVLMINSFKSKK